VHVNQLAVALGNRCRKRLGLMSIACPSISRCGSIDSVETVISPGGRRGRRDYRVDRLVESTL
jgi:hypothetical protein